jgi:hypothetical protein
MVQEITNKKINQNGQKYRFFNLTTLSNLSNFISIEIKINKIG